MAGRKPVPTVLNLVRGNPGKRPLRPKEPRPPGGATMPIWISTEAQQHWPSIAGQLEACGVLTQIDAPALALYCETFARWRQATAKVLELGMMVRAPSGYPVQSPYLSIANKAQDQMLKILVEFGMTPSSRTRVSAADIDTTTQDKKTGLARFR